MATAIRTIGHEDRLSLVDHLEELRTRLIVSASCWRSRSASACGRTTRCCTSSTSPLERRPTSRSQGARARSARRPRPSRRCSRSHARRAAIAALLSAPGSGLPAAARAQLPPLIASLQADVGQDRRGTQGDKPVTLGVGEPFTTTITVVFCLRADHLAAGDPVRALRLRAARAEPERETRCAPLLIAVPFLFVIGVLFGYFVVLPAAVRFFVNFNSGEFNVLVQAGQYYKFAATVLLAMGLRVPGAGGDPGRHPRRARHAAAAAHEPPLCDRGLRGGRRVPARRRDHAAAGDRPAVRAL